MNSRHTHSFAYQSFLARQRQRGTSSRSHPTAGKKGRAHAVTNTNRGRPQSAPGKRRHRAARNRKLEENWDNAFTSSRRPGTAARRSRAPPAPAAGSGLDAIRRNRSTPSLQREGGAPSPPSTAHTQRSRVEPNRFARQCERLTALWEELRVPMRDREFFFRAYCRDATPKNAARVQAQLRLVTDHRAATLYVLQCVQLREGHLERLRRQCAALSHRDRAGGRRDTWRAQLAQQVRAVREATVDVVEAIVRWRRHLWRPQPFVWQGTNYLLKMERDGAFLNEDAVSDVLRDVLLLPSGLGDTIVFLPSAESQEDDSGISVDGDHAEQLAAVRKVVLAERALQKELNAEHDRLLRSGFYIPTLRWSPDDKVTLSSADEVHDGDAGLEDGIDSGRTPEENHMEEDGSVNISSQDLRELISSKRKVVMQERSIDR